MSYINTRVPLFISTILVCLCINFEFQVGPAKFMIELNRGVTNYMKLTCPIWEIDREFLTLIKKDPK